MGVWSATGYDVRPKSAGQCSNNIIIKVSKRLYVYSCLISSRGLGPLSCLIKTLPVSDVTTITLTTLPGKQSFQVWLCPDP